MIALDSKDMFTTLFTQRNSTYKSNRANVNVTRYENEAIHADDIIWISRKVNNSDHRTKTDSMLTQVLVYKMVHGTISIFSSRQKFPLLTIIRDEFQKNKK